MAEGTESPHDTVPGLGRGSIPDSWTEVTLPDGARIIEDGGYLREPDAGGRGSFRRPIDGVRRLLAQSSPLFWFFVLLAVIRAGTIVANYQDAWFYSGSESLWMLLSVVGAVVAALLPAAVLIWRPDAWRSARLVLVGAIVWTTLPAMAELAGWTILRSQDRNDQVRLDYELISLGASIAAYAGPAIVALGLERTRRTRTRWPLPLVLGGLMGIVLTAVANAAGSFDWFNQVSSATEPGFGEDPILRVFLVGQLVSPLALLCLGILAWSSLSAVRAGEIPRRLWQCTFAGALVLAALSLYWMVSLTLLPLVSALEVVLGTDWYLVALQSIAATGGGLMLAAFTATAWSRADRSDEGSGAPNSVLAWGDDDYGQADAPQELADVSAIAAGDGFSLALRTGGTVVAWGGNEHGQTNVPAGLSGVTAISAGRAFSLALRSDGTVVAWGDNGYGQLDVSPGLANVAAVSAGAFHVLALLADGRVVAWGAGDRRRGAAHVPSRLRKIKAVAAGDGYSLAIRTD